MFDGPRNRTSTVFAVTAFEPLVTQCAAVRICRALLSDPVQPKLPIGVRMTSDTTPP